MEWNGMEWNGLKGTNGMEWKEHSIRMEWMEGMEINIRRWPTRRITSLYPVLGSLPHSTAHRHTAETSRTAFPAARTEEMYVRRAQYGGRDPEMIQLDEAEFTPAAGDGA